MALLESATDDLRWQLGNVLGRLDRELASFAHPGTDRQTPWDLARTAELHPLLDLLENDLRPFVEAGLERFGTRVRPRLGDLRRSVIHNDANDYNLLVAITSDGTQKLSGLIDFGDMLETMTVAELAIACAYAMLDQEEPKKAAEEVRSGYEQALLLSTLERDLLPDLIVARLCGSLLLSAQAGQHDPDNEYIQISRRPVADLLRKLS
jgi:Ser/Thr protein kinase RdoA (MazF antagonist)